MTQKQLITEISNEKGISKVWMAGILQLNRQRFNFLQDNNKLTSMQIAKLKKETGYE